MSDPPFIVFEGIEGSGKTTQIQMLRPWLDQLNLNPVIAREPGGTPVGERIRDTLLNHVDLVVPPRTELLLYLAARAAFVREVVDPGLARGAVVISDRFSWSTLAYQGYGRRIPLGEVRSLDEFATAGRIPDLYLVLDVPARSGRRRQEGDGKVADRVETEGEEFLERVRAGYLSLASESELAVVLDGTAPPEEVQGRVRRVLVSRFPETFASGTV